MVGSFAFQRFKYSNAKRYPRVFSPTIIITYYAVIVDKDYKGFAEDFSLECPWPDIIAELLG